MTLLPKPLHTWFQIYLAECTVLTNLIPPSNTAQACCLWLRSPTNPCSSVSCHCWDSGPHEPLSQTHRTLPLPTCPQYASPLPPTPCLLSLRPMQSACPSNFLLKTLLLKFSFIPYIHSSQLGCFSESSPLMKYSHKVWVMFWQQPWREALPSLGTEARDAVATLQCTVQLSKSHLVKHVCVQGPNAASSNVSAAFQPSWGLDLLSTALHSVLCRSLCNLSEPPLPGLYVWRISFS